MSVTPMEERINQAILDGEEWIVKNINHPQISTSEKIEMIKTLELSRLGDWIRDVDIQLTELRESIEYNLSEIKDNLLKIESVLEK